MKKTTVKIMISMVLLTIVFLGLGACKAAPGEKTFEKTELESVSLQLVKKEGDADKEIKLVKAQENQYGIFYFYQVGDRVSAVNFYKMEQERFKLGLQADTVKKTATNIHESSLYEKNIFTYFVSGEKPANASQLVLTIKEKKGIVLEEVAVPLDIQSTSFYYGYQREFTQQVYVEYSFK